jgi:hypothetical protein
VQASTLKEEIMYIKVTEESNHTQFAAIDIARRAKHAVAQNPALFGSTDHQSQVAAVEEAGRTYFAGWKAIYATARPSTRKRAAHTEVKFDKVMFRSKNQDAARMQFMTELAAAGVSYNTDVIYKPKTNSISVLVF